MKLKKIAYGVLAPAALLWTLSSFNPAQTFSAVKSKEQIEEVYTTKTLESTVKHEVPHYLKDLRTFREIKEEFDKKGLDEFDQAIALTSEIFRMYQTMNLKTQRQTVTISNFDEEETISLYGKKTRIIYGDYVRDGDKVIYSSPLGNEILTLEQFEIVKNDLKQAYKKAIEIDAEIYKDFPDRLKGKLEKILGIEDLDSIADKKIPGYKGITYGDILRYSKIEPKDFVINELYLSMIPALGVSIVNSQIVLYNPLGRAQDYIMGWPSTLAHELTHACKKLQSIPFSWEFDVELQASYTQLKGDPMNLDLIDYLLSSYWKPVRNAEKLYFSFDSGRMLDGILSAGRVGNYEMVKEKLKEELPKMRAVMSEFKKVLPDAFAEFYTNPIYWMVVNEKLKDNNAWFDIIMAKTYDPTYLKDEGRINQGALEDIKFLTEIEGSGLLEEIMDEAKIKLDEKKEGSGEGGVIGYSKDYKKIEALLRTFHVDSMTKERIIKQLNQRGIKNINDIPREELEQFFDSFLGGLKK